VRWYWSGSRSVLPAHSLRSFVLVGDGVRCCSDLDPHSLRSFVGWLVGLPTSLAALVRCWCRSAPSLRSVVLVGLSSAPPFGRRCWFGLAALLPSVVVLVGARAPRYRSSYRWGAGTPWCRGRPPPFCSTPFQSYTRARARKKQKEGREERSGKGPKSAISGHVTIYGGKAESLNAVQHLVFMFS